MERATETHIRREAQEIIEASFDLIERMLRVLDRLDPDPDAEDNGDCEPLLGWPNAGQPINAAMATDDDRELDNADHEDNGDAEPDSDAEPEDGI